MYLNRLTDPSVKLEALESVIAPKLRTGRFKATDKLIEMLKAAPDMRSKRRQNDGWAFPIQRGVRIKMDSALNRSFKECNEVFPNATCMITLLDRLLHHADVTVIEGESYRVRESELETAARRRKK